MSAPDGGPAFPFKCQGSTTAPEFYYGMTLRDYFAAQETLGDLNEIESLSIMAEVVGRPFPDSGWKPGNMVEMYKFLSDFRASMKYIRADAMIRARDKEAA